MFSDNTVVSMDLNGTGCAEVFVKSLAYTGLTGLAIGGALYLTAFKPTLEDLKAIDGVSKNARPIGTDSYLLTVNFNEIRILEKPALGTQGEGAYLATQKDSFERQYPNLEVMAVLDRTSSISPDSRFKDLGHAIDQLGHNQFIFVCRDK